MQRRGATPPPLLDAAAELAEQYDGRIVTFASAPPEKLSRGALERSMR
jgi:hypothetical protein